MTEDGLGPNRITFRPDGPDEPTYWFTGPTATDVWDTNRWTKVDTLAILYTSTKRVGQETGHLGQDRLALGPTREDAGSLRTDA